MCHLITGVAKVWKQRQPFSHRIVEGNGSQEYLCWYEKETGSVNVVAFMVPLMLTCLKCVCLNYCGGRNGLLAISRCATLQQIFLWGIPLSLRSTFCVLRWQRKRNRASIRSSGFTNLNRKKPWHTCKDAFFLVDLQSGDNLVTGKETPRCRLTSFKNITL